MIIQFICLVCVSSLLEVLIDTVSGGALFQIVNPAIALVLLLSGGAVLFVSGCIKDLKLLFLPPKKMATAEITELKNTKNALEQMIKTFFIPALFISCAAFVVFMFNYTNLQTVGPNLATLLIAPATACMYAVILVPLAAKCEKQATVLMAEQTGDSRKNTSAKKILLSVLRVALFIAFLIAAFRVIYHTSLKNETDFSFTYIFDLPSFMVMTLFPLSSLFFSGTLRDFGKAFKTIFGNCQYSISEKNQMHASIELVIRTLLYSSILMTITNFFAILTHLEARTYLAENMFVGVVPLLFAALFSFVLIPIDAIICRRQNDTGLSKEN